MLQSLVAWNVVMPRSDTARFALGAGLTLGFVALVEILIAVEAPPLGPVGWPALGMLVAGALGGVAAMAGGGATLAGYCLLNAARPERFPEFFAAPQNIISWTIALSLLAASVLVFRPRVLRLQAAEAELAARRDLEAALRDSEARLRVITDNLPALVSYIDADERYRFNNRAYEQLLGLPRSRVTGRTVREVWGEERYRGFKPSIERALRGERVSHEHTTVRGTSTVRVLVTFVPDLDPRGRVKGFFVLGIDVTRLAAAQRELRAAHARLETALDGSNVALWDTDLTSGRVYLSDAWAAIIGDAPGDTVAATRDLLARVHPDDVESVRRASLEAQEGASGAYAVEHRVRAHDGEWLWILSRGRVTERDPASGRALRMIGTAVDITGRRRTEQAARK